METATSKWDPDHTGSPLGRKELIYLAAFYLGIPVAFALQSGAAESGSFTFIEKRYYFLYALAAGLPTWWAMDICTRIVNRLIRPWDPPLVVVLIPGAILALNLQALWSPFRQSLFVPYLAEGSSFYAVFPWRYGDPEYLTEAIIIWLSGSAIWCLANLFYVHILAFPRFGYRVRPEGVVGPATDAPAAAPAESAATATVPSHNLLLEKLPKDLGTEIIALKAEEHYTRVYTQLGETLVLMRFSDAVGLLQDLHGLQTHRSYWANAAHISELVREGRSSHLRLSTGLDIPVSRSYRVQVQEALSSAAQ